MRLQTRLMSAVNSNQRIDLECCIVCSGATRKTGTTKRTIIKIRTCELCINAHFGEYKSLLKSSYKMVKWTCYLCSALQEVREELTELSYTVPFCLKCPLALVRDKLRMPVRKKLNDQEARISFLQYEPSDVSLVGADSDKRIEAHRSVLVSKSPVFKAMMEVNMKETLTGIIQMEDMPAAVVEAAVNFMYKGAIEFSGEVLPEDVLRFAYRYEIPFLKMLCEKELLKEVTTENFGKMFSISDEFGLDVLKKKATECFTECFNDHPNDHTDLLENLYQSCGRKRARDSTSGTD